MSPARPDPAAGEVLLVHAELPFEAGALEAARSLLSGDERARADRLLIDHRRDEFVAVRGWLRLVLGAALDADPSALRFVYGEHGKPDLAEDPTGLRFNVSHANGLAVCALTRAGEVGVDVEHRDRKVDVLPVGRRFFSRAEFAVLESSPEAAARDVFLRCWTRKEAYVKALGPGISFGLGEFDVSLEPDAPALLANRKDPGAPERWTILAPDVGSEHHVALAVDCRDVGLRCVRFPPVR